MIESHASRLEKIQDGPGSYFRRLCEVHDLVAHAANSDHRNTWYSGDGQASSLIDYIVAPRHLKVRRAGQLTKLGRILQHVEVNTCPISQSAAAMQDASLPSWLKRDGEQENEQRSTRRRRGPGSSQDQMLELTTLMAQSHLQADRQNRENSGCLKITALYSKSQQDTDWPAWD